MSARPSFHIIELAVLGDGSVGKTATLRRLKGLSFDYDYKMTLGADFVVKEMQFGFSRITLQIWDVGGQEKFAPLRSRYYRNAKGIVVVFDLMKRSTFDNIPVWLTEVLENNNWRLVPIMLCGNKNDLLDDDPREIKQGEILEYVNDLKQWGQGIDPNFQIKYTETSAKAGSNVEETFKELLNMILTS